MYVTTRQRIKKKTLCRVPGQVTLGKELKKIKKTFAECQIGGTRQRGDLTPPAGPAHTHCTHAHKHAPAPPCVHARVAHAPALALPSCPPRCAAGGGEREEEEERRKKEEEKEEEEGGRRKEEEEVGAPRPSLPRP